MKEKVMDLLCKKVRLMDETYTIGGILSVFLFIILFLILCGMAESI